MQVPGMFSGQMRTAGASEQKSKNFDKYFAATVSRTYVCHKLWCSCASQSCDRHILATSRFARASIFAELDYIITQLGLDMARQRENFARQWHVAEVRITTMSGEDIGWLLTERSDSTLFLGQLYLSVHMQRQGIGTLVLQMLIEEARRAGKRITLGVVKINPARRLYERLGFQRTHEDRHKVYMRLEPGG
jgi:GNAT superfamily N-acetyltransferase